MMPQDLKNSLLQNWQSCREAVCSAARKIAGKTKALFRDWKYAGQLVCVGVAATAFVLILATTPAHSQENTYDLMKLNIPFDRWNILGGPVSLNDKGEIVGWLWDIAPGSNDLGHGFFYDSNGGAVISFLNYPGASETGISDINNKGVIVGNYVRFDAKGENIINSSGFIYKNGGFSRFKVPFGSTWSQIGGINNYGHIVGTFSNTHKYYYYWGEPASGFIYKNGSYSTFSYPGAQMTIPYSINDQGDIVGCYRMAPGYEQYTFLYKNGAFTTLGNCGRDFSPQKINNHGQITGVCDAEPSNRCLYEIGEDGPSYKPGIYSINNKGQMVVLRCDPPNNQSNCFYYLASPKIPVPVIVIPGIVGSMSSCLFVNPESGQACPDNYEFVYAHSFPGWVVPNINLTPEWILDPTVMEVYKSLVQELRNSGTPVYEMPYDWRKKNDDTAKTLRDLIERAKRETGSKKVDIVAHSMGGLVARYYIEKVQKTANVRKLVMLGTPNRGSCNAYYSWEGADFSKSGFVANNFFFSNLIEDMYAAYDRDDLTVQQFVRFAVPALQQLLPADYYLYRKDNIGKPVVIKISDMKFHNEIVPVLNSNTLTKKLGIDNIRIFAGNTKDTIGSILVDRDDNGTYPDGAPIRTFRSVLGDGVVSSVSARLGNSGVSVLSVDAEHTRLPDVCRANVVRFLAGEALQATNSVKAETPSALSTTVPSNLFIGTSEKINMGLTTLDGRRLGKFPFEETKVIEVDNPYYRGNNEHTAAIGMSNPSAGEYTLNISTRELQTDYKIVVSYTDKTGTNTRELIRGAVTRDDVQTRRFKLRDASGMTLELR